MAGIQVKNKKELDALLEEMKKMGEKLETIPDINEARKYAKKMFDKFGISVEDIQRKDPNFMKGVKLPEG